MEGRPRAPHPVPVSLPDYAVILNPTDGSPASWPASQHAVALARRLRAQLIVVYVVDEPLAIESGLYMAGALEELTEEGERATRAVADLARSYNVQVTPLVVRGRPGDAILDLARSRRADIIVMGSRGKSALERVLLGSVSEHVLRHAPCLVAILRA